jgi:hypothetical protein
METGKVVGRGYFEHKRCPFGGVYCPLRRTVNKTAEKGSDKKEGCWRLRANPCGFMGWFDINFLCSSFFCLGKMITDRVSYLCISNLLKV